MRRISTYIALLAIGAMAAGCAKSATTNANDGMKRSLDAWLGLNYPSVEATGDGIYILEETAGTGEAYDGDTHDYVYVDYTITDLEGTISSSTSLQKAYQLGTYYPSYYYGPKVWATGKDYMTAGVENVLEGMRVGGTRKAVIPSWLQTTERYSSADDYFEVESSSSHTIYTITLRECIEDVIEWQIDSIETFLSNKGVKADSTEYGLYYVQTKAPDTDAAFESDSTVYANYIARRLDGTVFDTSIADTAKVWHIYSSSKTYTPVKITWDADDYEDMTMYLGGSSSSSSVISGFARGLFEMKDHEKGYVVFTSAWGYTSSGSGSNVPAYSPLLFEFEIVDEPVD